MLGYFELLMDFLQTCQEGQDLLVLHSLNMFIDLAILSYQSIQQSKRIYHQCNTILELQQSYFLTFIFQSMIKPQIHLQLSITKTCDPIQFIISLQISYLQTLQNINQLTQPVSLSLLSTLSTFMIKDVLINRFSDGTVFCQTSDDLTNNELQNVRIKVKNFHRQATPYTKPQIPTIRQIENRSFGIYYKINSYVVFTVIVQNGYPVKLINVFLDTIISSFFDQAKTILGTHDMQSRLQSIQGSHYFVKFDRIIKQKKKQFDDPKSMKNIERMKRELESIQQIMKQNMTLIDQRQRNLQETQEKARKVVDESKQFQRRTNKLKWNMWFKKNLIWIVLVITILVIGWLFI